MRVSHGYGVAAARESQEHLLFCGSRLRLRLLVCYQALVHNRPATFLFFLPFFFFLPLERREGDNDVVASYSVHAQHLSDRQNNYPCEPKSQHRLGNKGPQPNTNDFLSLQHAAMSTRVIEAISDVKISEQRTKTPVDVRRSKLLVGLAWSGPQTA